MNWTHTHQAAQALAADGYTVTNISETFGLIPGAIVEIAFVLPVSGATKRIEIMAPRTAFGGQRINAAVSWASIGAVEGVDAETYGQAIVAAAHLADAMNADVAS